MISNLPTLQLLQDPTHWVPEIIWIINLIY